jgi:hypothetical protein
MNTAKGLPQEKIYKIAGIMLGPHENSSRWQTIFF